MLKLLFEYLTSTYSLVENPVNDLVLLGVIGSIAFSVSYRIVGWPYREDFILGSGVGSFMHWTIRFIVLAGLHCVLATAIKIYAWIVSVPVYAWWITLGIILGGVIIFWVWNHSRTKKVALKAKN